MSSISPINNFSCPNPSSLNLVEEIKTLSKDKLIEKAKKNYSKFHQVDNLLPDLISEGLYSKAQILIEKIQLVPIVDKIKGWSPLHYLADTVGANDENIEEALKLAKYLCKEQLILVAFSGKGSLHNVLDLCNNETLKNCISGLFRKRWKENPDEQIRSLLRFAIEKGLTSISLQNFVKNIDNEAELFKYLCSIHPKTKNEKENIKGISALFIKHHTISLPLLNKALNCCDDQEIQVFIANKFGEKNKDLFPSSSTNGKKLHLNRTDTRDVLKFFQSKLNKEQTSKGKQHQRFRCSKSKSFPSVSFNSPSNQKIKGDEGPMINKTQMIALLVLLGLVALGIWRWKAISARKAS
ncbi:hypothetical protein [Candidatus Neptunochlamydia vexilliferae]|uniref:hypothetical protein n=1 Tax=Candidatus Neptunichlamydia vexilliferae TaxID=1651774 RepID=UPI001891CA97|nr:hypothetical protein [Candidatus Neptunochlamydia vexilliferae]